MTLHEGIAALPRGVGVELRHRCEPAAERAADEHAHVS